MLWMAQRFVKFDSWGLKDILDILDSIIYFFSGSIAFQELFGWFPYNLARMSSREKQPFADVFQNRCSEKFCNIQRKTPVLSLFLIKLQAFSFENCEFFKNSLFYRIFLVAAFVKVVLKYYRSTENVS